MYYILYEGLKIESNEPVYCTVYSVQCTMHNVHCTLYITCSVSVKLVECTRAL